MFQKNKKSISVLNLPVLKQLYKFTQTEDKSFYYLSPSKNGETMNGVIKLPVNNSCTVTETVLKKNKKEKEEKIRSDNNKKREYGQQKLTGNDAYLIEGYNVYTKVSLQKNDQKCNKNFCKYKTKCSFTYDEEGSYWTRNDKTNCPASLSISEYAKKDEEGFEYYAIENSDKKIAFQDYVKPNEIEVSVKQYEQRKKMIEQEKSRLPSSCKEFAHLKIKERGIFGGKTDKVITIGDILAEKKVDNYDIKCGRLQNIFNESIVLSIGYAKEGDDYRGVFFKERNGWILCRGIYAGDDMEDDKGKCEYFLSGYGGFIRTSLEELRGF